MFPNIYTLLIIITILTPHPYIEQTSEVNQTLYGSELHWSAPVILQQTTHIMREYYQKVNAMRLILCSSVYRQHSLDKPHDLGKFTVTAYCPCRICCGEWSQYKLTASGTHPKQGRTIAVDETVIPLGTTVYIDNIAYIAEDTGSAVHGKHIDVYFNNHQDAIEYGVQEHHVLIKQQIKN